MLKRKIATVALLIAVLVTALGLHFTAVSQTANQPAHVTYAIPNDPPPQPIIPPPH